MLVFLLFETYNWNIRIIIGVNKMGIAITIVGGIVVIALAGIITDSISERKKLEIKRIKAEIELEQLKLNNFEKETEKLKLELQQEKQNLLEYKYVEKKKSN